MKQALLIAGPFVLDDLGDQTNLLGGAGVYAAMGARPVTPTQLWSQAGVEVDERLRGILEHRRIDLAGVDCTGAVARWRPSGFQPGRSVLPERSPTNPENLGAVLLIDLPMVELRRALEVIGRFPKADTRPVVIAPRAADPGEADLATAAAAADVLILPLTLAAGDPLGFAGRLQASGAKCVCLTAGMAGGIVVYQQKATTWPALPVEIIEATGIGSSFAGALAGACAEQGKADFSTIKRGLAVASAVASITAQGVGPKKLLAADAKVYEERFNRLRRTHKF